MKKLLSYLKTRPLALISLAVILLLYLLMIFAEFIAPYSATRAFESGTFHPSNIEFSAKGLGSGLAVREYRVLDSITWRYAKVKGIEHKLKFFVHGEPYKLFGLIPSDVHLFGTQADSLTGESYPIFLLGADNLGRDMFSRMVHGSRISLTIGFVASAVSLILAVILGGIAGFYGGAVDWAIMRFSEFFMLIPGLYLILFLRSLMNESMDSGQSYMVITLILSLVGWPSSARTLRGMTHSIKREEFVLNARLEGIPSLVIIFRHIIPQITSLLIVSTTLAVPGFIMSETTLSYLGLGIADPAVSWGAMINREISTLSNLKNFPWLLNPVWLLLAVTLAFNFFGDALRDFFDPYHAFFPTWKRVFAKNSKSPKPEKNTKPQDESRQTVHTDDLKTPPLSDTNPAAESQQNPPSDCAENPPESRQTLRTDCAENPPEEGANPAAQSEVNPPADKQSTRPRIRCQPASQSNQDSRADDLKTPPLPGTNPAAESRQNPPADYTEDSLAAEEKPAPESPRDFSESDTKPAPDSWQNPPADCIENPPESSAQSASSQEESLEEDFFQNLTPVFTIARATSIPSRVAGSTFVGDEILRVSDLNVSFAVLRGSKYISIKAVRGVSFSMRKGEILGIVGESGSGKTVSTSAIAGLLGSESLVTGNIIFDGVDLTSIGNKAMRAYRGKRIGMIFQESGRSFDPLQNIGSVFLETFRNWRPKITRDKANKEACRLLEEVGLTDCESRLKNYPHQFSGGQLQRISIALALAQNCDLLIADEPTTALDVTIQAQIVDLLAKLRRTRSLSIIFISHNLELVAKLCDNIIVMYGGIIVESGSSRHIMRNPSHPYTKALRAASPAFGSHYTRQRLISIPGRVSDPSRPEPGCPFAPRCSLASEICVKPECMRHCPRADNEDDVITEMNAPFKAEFRMTQGADEEGGSDE